MTLLKPSRDFVLREIHASAVVAVLLIAVLVTLMVCNPTHGRGILMTWEAGIAWGIIEARLIREFRWLRRNPSA